MDSIAKFTKKYCRGPYQILSTVLLAAMSYFAFTGFNGVWGVVCGAVTAVMALLVVIHMTGLPIGCTLLQIPLWIVSVVAFLGAMAASTTGFMIVRFPETEATVHTVVENFGISLDSIAHWRGEPFAWSALVLFFLSTAAFAATSYLATVKECLKGTISRRAAGLFSVFAALLAAAAGIAAVWTCLTRMAFDAAVTESLLLAALCAAAGLSAKAFLKSTYAFKVFEEQVMKVETNADGTVYVPIQEDSANPDAPIPVPVPAASERRDSADRTDGRKPFLRAFDSAEAQRDAAGSAGECEIL